MGNTVNDLRYEIKFENRVKDESNFFIKQSIVFLFLMKIYFILILLHYYIAITYLFKIPKNFIALTFFLLMQILKNMDKPRQKPRMLHW